MDVVFANRRRWGDAWTPGCPDEILVNSSQLCACMDTHNHTYLHTHTYICTYLRTHIHRVCMQRDTKTYMYIYIRYIQHLRMPHIRTSMCTHITNTHTCIHTHMYVHITNTQTHMHRHRHILQIHTHTCACAHACTHTHMQAHIHTHARTHIHTHVCAYIPYIHTYTNT